jgi:hypothetical protein
MKKAMSSSSTLQTKREASKHMVNSLKLRKLTKRIHMETRVMRALASNLTRNAMTTVIVIRKSMLMRFKEIGNLCC